MAPPSNNPEKHKTVLSLLWTPLLRHKEECADESRTTEISHENRQIVEREFCFSLQQQKKRRRRRSDLFLAIHPFRNETFFSRPSSLSARFSKNVGLSFFVGNNWSIISSIFNFPRRVLKRKKNSVGLLCDIRNCGQHQQQLPPVASNNNNNKILAKMKIQKGRIEFH
jgi:hypothetical protein